MKNVKRTAAYKRGVTAANADHEAVLASIENVDYDKIPEIAVQDDASGKRLLVPVRAMAKGMHAWMRGER